MNSKKSQHYNLRKHHTIISVVELNSITILKITEYYKFCINWHPSVNVHDLQSWFLYKNYLQWCVIYYEIKSQFKVILERWIRFAKEEKNETKSTEFSRKKPKNKSS